MTVGKDFIFFVNQTLMRFFSSCINMFNVVLGRLGPEPGRLQPVCSVCSLNLDTLDAVKMCNFSPVIWMTKSLQTGWHCTYLASTHWHGNLAAFNRRCHFPTTQKQRGFHAGLPGGFPLTAENRGAAVGREGAAGDPGPAPQVCRLSGTLCVILLQIRPCRDSNHVYMFILDSKRDWKEFFVEKWDDEEMLWLQHRPTHVWFTKKTVQVTEQGLSPDSRF